MRVSNDVHCGAARAAWDGLVWPQGKMRMGRLSGKAVLITGAGKGIGKEAALLFAREGASVTIADVDVEGGDGTRGLIEGQGGKALFVRTDITKPEDVQATVDKAVAKFGK